MMGQAVGQQDRLFYEFNLDERIPVNHLLRHIDAVLDLTWLRGELAPYYSHTGYPSIDPELMIRILLVGYCYSICSERRLCQEAELNLAYRWFCRLGLEDKVPHHSTFSVNRHGRFRDSDLLRQVFESVVCHCMEAGFVGDEGFAVDDWSEQQLARHAIKEYVAALESENSQLNPDKLPKALSPSDPAAAWTTRGRNKVMFSYSLNYLSDMEHAVIVDVEATPTRITKEVDATETMIARAQDRYGLKPAHIAGDVAYGTGEMLDWLLEREIAPHIPIKDMSQRKDRTLSRADFIFDAERDVYVCPDDKTLTTTGRVFAGNTLYYRARKLDCDHCPLKPRCCPNAPVRRIPRDVKEAARDYVRAHRESAPFLQSRRERKKIETRFADLKSNPGSRGSGYEG